MENKTGTATFFLYRGVEHFVMHPVPRLVICSGNKCKRLGQGVLFSLCKQFC
ncbi:hypothetical protein EMIT019CA3_160087 [Bacillus pseudomycoides]|nr:hypothetical protein bmyco0003_14690 [Bacillus pseudomycoides]